MVYSKQDTAVHLAVRRWAHTFLRSCATQLLQDIEYNMQQIPETERKNVQSPTYDNFNSTNLSSFTSAGIPPLLNIASNPCLWCDKL